MRRMRTLSTLSRREFIESAVGLGAGAATSLLLRPRAATGAVAAQTLRYPYVEPVTMDPGIADSATYVLQNVWEGLLDFDEQSNPVPQGATSWDISSDGLVYTFHLRPGVTWTDGTLITAQDYEWTWKRNVDPKTGSSYAQALYDIKNAQAYNKGNAPASAMGVKALDDKTLQVTLEHPAGYFLRVASTWTAYALPQQIIQKNGAKWTEAANVVSNGPFRIQSWQHGQQIVLVPNERYWGGKPGVSVVVTLMDDVAKNSLPAYENNQLDVAFGPWPADIDRIEQDPVLGKQLRVYPNSQCTSIVCDVTNSNSPVSTLPFRQALYLAIDRDKIVNDVLKKVGVVAYTIIPPGIIGNNPAARIPGGVRDAQAALARAGFSGGKGVPTLTLTYPQNNVNDLVLQVLQQMWNTNLGINITLNRMERQAFNAWQRSLKNQHYDLHLGTWGSDYLDPFNWHNFLFASTTDYYHSHWVDPEFDKLVNQGAYASDQKERTRLYQEAEVSLVRSAAVIPVYRNGYPYLFKPWVKGFLHTSLGFDRFAATTISPH